MEEGVIREYVFEVEETHYVHGTGGTGTSICERRERVTRCRDCVHWRKPTDRERSRCTGVMAVVEPTPEGFCAWGKPREVE